MRCPFCDKVYRRVVDRTHHEQVCVLRDCTRKVTTADEGDSGNPDPITLRASANRGTPVARLDPTSIPSYISFDDEDIEPEVQESPDDDDANEYCDSEDSASDDTDTDIDSDEELH